MSIRFVWKIPIKAPPDQVWRYVADTNRVNQYAGLPEFTFRYVPEEDGGSHQIGETRYMGWRLRWDEHPFEWIEGRKFEVLRSYHNGPLKDFRTTVELQPTPEGSLLIQTIVCQPRWFFVTPALYWEVGVTYKRRFVAAYQKIEKFLQGDSQAPLENVPRQAIPPGRIQAIQQRMEKASGKLLLPRLIEAIETLPDEEVDRMRPFVFADRWAKDRCEVLKLFLQASQAGLIDLSWDVICPGCRGAPERHESLKNMKLEAHCPACNIKYDTDFAESVEITFRPNPSIRKVEVVRYCSGGPMNAPHVVAQQQIPPGQARTINLTLQPWRYRVRSLKLTSETFLRIERGTTASSATIRLHRPTLEPETLELGPEVALTLKNEDSKPITVLIERVAGNEQAATAAMVIAMNEFRTLFSEEVLAPDTPISVGAVTLMFTDLKSSTMLYEDIGEAPAYGLVRRHFELLTECIAQCEGAVVKTIGDSVMAAFVDPAKAVEAALAMHRAMASDNTLRGNPCLSLKIGIHHAPCIAVNMNNLLDYFGTAVNVTARIQKESLGGDIVVTDEVWQDPHVQEVLGKSGLGREEIVTTLRGLSGERTVHRLFRGI